MRAASAKRKRLTAAANVSKLSGGVLWNLTFGK
jgi:hypothetical protein